MPLLLQRALSALLGRGIGGTLGAMVINLLIRKLRDGDEPATLDTRQLKAGETYQVVVRPGPTKAERAAQRRRESAAVELDALVRPAGRARRAGLAVAKLEAAQRTGKGSSPRAAAKLAKRRRRFERLTASASEIEAARAHLAEADAELTTIQNAAFESASASRPRTVRRRRPRA